MEVLDIIKSFTKEERDMIAKGKHHWEMGVLNTMSNGHVSSQVIKYLINQVIENTWAHAKKFYSKTDNKPPMIRVHYATECGSDIATMKLDELESFITRYGFTILSIKPIL